MATECPRSRALTSLLRVAALAMAGLQQAPAQAVSAEALHTWWQTCSVGEAAQWLVCAAAREAEALAGSRDSALRQGAELSLRNGSPAAAPLFVDRAAADGGWRRHFYLGALDGVEAQLVLSLEDGQAPRFEFVPLGASSGLQLAALPWPAPGGRLMAVVAGADGQPGGSISLLQRAGSRWSQQFRYEPPASVIFQFRQWRADGASLRLDWQRGSGNKPCAPLSGSLHLRDGPYGWDFVPAPPPACPR